MPHVRLIIGIPIKESPASWALAHGFGDIRLLFEEILHKPEQVAVFPETNISLEPANTRLGLEFVLETGIYYQSQGVALATALALYQRIAQPNVRWKLPRRWGIWFRHKGPFDDIFVSPETYAAVKAHCDRAFAKAG